MINMHTVYLALGTNLGNRKAIMREAIDNIGKTVGLQYVDRIIDIDILLYDDLHINEPDLVIPHPLMEEREFVMKPLLEIKE